MGKKKKKRRGADKRNSFLSKFPIDFILLYPVFLLIRQGNSFDIRTYFFWWKLRETFRNKHLSPSECSGTAVPTEHILLQDLGLRGELFKITIQIFFFSTNCL